ncbi:N-6 DNA methylase [bacterium]|nr:N-6 DNA methylase [bacterium]
MGEENLKPGFLADIFGEALGYRTPNQSPDGFTLVPEFRIPGSQQFADAALGPKPQDGRNVVVAVEIKGPLDPLDIPHGGRRLSAVMQGFDYAINLPCDWILVSSMVETRLYYKGADRFTCERFFLSRLVESESALRRFLFILGASRVIPETGRSHLYDLLEESRIAGENITKAFYQEYSQQRFDAFVRLTQSNPELERPPLLSATQKILDRILFCSFAEDRGLLPAETVRHAFEYSDPYNPHPKWENFKGLFRSINEGNPQLNIPRYNGGLFAPDECLDELTVPDEVCGVFKRLADYDFRALEVAEQESLDDLQQIESIVDVEILGHIFEQSITDLERLRLELEQEGTIAPPSAKKAKSRRKREGAFYTPKFITRYIVEHTLGPVLADRLESLRLRHIARARGTATQALECPTSYDLEELNNPQREALIAFWLDWQEELGRVRILDPACGSGAFLIEAFDQLLAAYQDANARLEALRGQAELFDLNRQILQQNLYGVDLNEEAVEICRLSLWIKTAERGKILTDLDHTIRVGNSIIADPTVDPRAFDWRTAFPEVFTEGGFDVVVGNPPYIRQEWLAPLKPHLEQHYEIYSGTADLYLYFVEKGLDVLKAGGRLGFITSGTFSRGNFASTFRKWLPTTARFTSLVNFGENQPFEDAEMVYPTMYTLKKNTEPAQFPTLFIHEKIPDSIEEEMKNEGLPCDESVFDESEWKFQPRAVTDLLHKIVKAGRPLGEVVGGGIYYGIKTGLNDAFIVDGETRDRLVAADAKSDEIIHRILQGQDLRPWYQIFADRHLIFTRRGIDIAEYPAVREYLESFRERLEPRPPDWAGRTSDWPGRKPGSYRWYELQDSIDYYQEFDHPKIIWPDIQKLPRFSWDEDGLYTNDKGYILIPKSGAELALLQSRLTWFCISQFCLPLRLRAGLWQYQSKLQFIERLPISEMDDECRSHLSSLAADITVLARERLGLHRATRHRIEADLCPEGGKLNTALTNWWDLDFSAFREQIKKAFKAEIPVRERSGWEDALAEWRGEHGRLTGRIIDLEEELNDRVYHLYGLTSQEVRTLEDFQKKTKTFYPFGEV